MSDPIDWRTVLIKYMAHVGDCEGVFFADDLFDPGIPAKDWQAIKDAAMKLCI